MNKREFYIETPLGKLKVWAKHDIDCATDFPGVYVDLVREGKGDELLACVEYIPYGDYLQTCVYQPGVEYPDIIIHDLEEEE